MNFKRKNTGDVGNMAIGGGRKLGLWPLVMTIFFCVSGGAYGLEPVVQSGHGMALLLIAFVPIIWALPIALMSAELGSAFPEEGGYYIWVREGIGPRSGLACGWLTYLYSCVDVAIYPVLFLNYLAALGFGAPADRPVLGAIIRLAMIVPLTWTNIRGAVTTGRAAMAFGIALLAPFAVMVAVRTVPAFSEFAALASPLTPPQTGPGEAFTAGLFVILWNYLGWDSISTISREMKDGARIFPKALMIGVPMVVLGYLLPVIIGLQAVPDVAQWTDGSWPVIARAVGGPTFGPALGTAIGLGGLVSAAGLFAAGLLAASRIPYVLAEDGFLPAAFVRLHTTYRTPTAAIVVSAAIYFILSSFTFEELAEVDVLLYSSALLLEFAALVRLRKRRPGLARPFRIPSGTAGVIAVAVMPALLVLAATLQMLRTAWTETIGIAAFALLTGAALFRYQRRNSTRPKNNP